MSTQYFDDPLEQAEHVQPPTRTYFGQVKVTSWFCVLEKGVGKVPFDPQEHKPEARRVAIRIELVPLPECNLQFEVMRELIAESAAWTKTILPSLVALEVSPRELHNKFVQIELVPTGRQWLDGSGQQREETMPRFVAVYPDRAACLAAYQANGNGAQVAPASPVAPATPGNGNGSNPERAAAAAFLKPMWTAAGGDLTKFLELIQKNPILSKHFSAESPEVVAIVAPF